MKNMLKLVAAASVAAASMNAVALEPWNDTPDLVINISGATAPDKLLRTMIQSICDTTANDYTEFSSDTSFPSKSRAAYYCTVDETAAAFTGLPIAADQKVLFRKRSQGGSFQGVGPVADDIAGEQLDLSDANSGAQGGGCAGIQNGNQYINCGDVEVVSSDAGTSDLPPDVFVSPNVSAGFDPCDADCVANLDSAAITQLGFGVPITNALYKALQIAQGKNPDSDGDLTDDLLQPVTDFLNDDTNRANFRANMPSLTKEQLAALFSNIAMNDWSDLRFYDSNTDESYGLTSFPGVAAPADTRVHICRRVNGSGTQATHNLNIMNCPTTAANCGLIATDNTPCVGVDIGEDLTTDNPPGDQVVNQGSACAFPFGTPADPNNQVGQPGKVTGLTGAKVVFENSGSGNVTSCMDEAQAANLWALGVQSLEKDSQLVDVNNPHGGWTFIAIDGEAPTLANVAMGKYFHWGAVSMQWAKTGGNVPTGDKLNILKALRTNLADPGELKIANDKVDFRFGYTGSLSATAPIVANPTTTGVWFDETLPVAQWEHPQNDSFQIIVPRDSSKTDFSVPNAEH